MMKLFFMFSNNLNVIGFAISLLALVVILVTNQHHFKWINTVFSCLIISVICYLIIKAVRDINTINLLLSSKLNVYFVELVGKLNLKPCRSFSDLFDAGSKSLTVAIKTRFKTKLVSPVVYYTNMIKASFFKAISIVVSIVRGGVVRFSTRSHHTSNPQFV